MIADSQSNNTGCIIVSALIAAPIFFRGTYWFGDQISQISRINPTTKLRRLARNARVMVVTATSAFGLIATPAIIGNGVATTYTNYHDRQQCGVKAPTRAQARACQRYWDGLQK